MTNHKINIFSKNWLVNKILYAEINKAAKFSKGQLLDIGCGNKPYLSIFKPFIKSYIGIDNIIPIEKPTDIDVSGDALMLPFVNCAFDTVALFCGLEHVKEPDLMIAEISRVLKKDGYLILTAPHISGLHCQPEDYFRFTKYALNYLVEKNNLEVIYIKPMGGYWVTTGQRFCYFVEHLKHFKLGFLLPIVYFFVHLITFIFILEGIYREERDTLNYIVVAKKI